jgi:hypothetical protein
MIARGFPSMSIVVLAFDPTRHELLVSAKFILEKVLDGDQLLFRPFDKILQRHHLVFRCLGLWLGSTTFHRFRLIRFVVEVDDPWRVEPRLLHRLIDHRCAGGGSKRLE